MKKGLVLIFSAILLPIMAVFLASQTANAYSSAVNPVDSANIPAAEMNRQIIFTDEALHRQLNRIFRGAESLAPFTIGEAQAAVGTTWSFELTRVSNLEGLQYFSGYWGYDDWRISGSVSDFAPFPEMLSGYQVTRWHSISIDTTAARIENLGGIKDGYSYINIKNEEAGGQGGVKGLISRQSMIGLSSFRNATYLGIYSVNVEDANPIGDMANLMELYLNDNEINDVHNLAKLTRLTMLTLRNNNISDVSFITDLDLSNFRDRAILDLNNNKVSDISPIINKPLSNRMGFSLINNEISTLSPMADSGNKFLILFGNKIADATLFDFAGTTDSIDVDGLDYNDTGLDLMSLFDDWGMREAVVFRGGQRPEIDVRQKTFPNPLRDRDGNVIPIIETELVKNGENGEIILLVNDEVGSVTVEWTTPGELFGRLKINYDLRTPAETSAENLQAPNTGVMASTVALWLLLAGVTLIGLTTLKKARK